jgi:tRNA (guanine37-N1)-methyltransferase
MLTFHIITLFPELIVTYCSASILGRGLAGRRFAIETYNPRDFCVDKYRKVDDTPYGGGAGMVMKPEPLFAALESISRNGDSPVILASPCGSPLTQEWAQRHSSQTDITIICGHYEGIDERVKTVVTESISLGDFVITGGELVALAIIDAVGRLIPGVVGAQESLVNESFGDGLLEAPHYTKPAVFRKMPVPDVLTSGDHKAIARWRRKESLKLTAALRPDLLAKAKLDKADKLLLQQIKDSESKQMPDLSRFLKGSLETK